MANDRSVFFNVLVLESILVALTREIEDGFVFVRIVWRFSVLIARKLRNIVIPT